MMDETIIDVEDTSFPGSCPDEQPEVFPVILTSLVDVEPKGSELRNEQVWDKIEGRMQREDRGSDEISKMKHVKAHVVDKSLQRANAEMYSGYKFKEGNELDMERFSKISENEREDYTKCQKNTAQNQFLHNTLSSRICSSKDTVTSTNTEIANKYVNEEGAHSNGGTSVLINSTDLLASSGSKPISTPATQNLEETVKTGNPPCDMSMVYVCSLCQVDFDSFTDITEHKKACHGERPFQCMMCDCAYNDILNLTSHINSHTGQTGFQCILCGKEFKMSRDLRLHLVYHIPDIGTQLYEGLTQSKAKQTAAGKEMIQKITGKSSQKQRLENDNDIYRYLLSEQLDLNQQRKHCVAKKKSCTVHKGRAALKGHTVYECLYCGKQLMKKHDKDVHMRCHTGERSYKCPWCRATFRRSQHRRDHMKIHAGQQLYWCRTCCKEFSSYSALWMHRGTTGCVMGIPKATRHEGRLFKCCTCDITFKTYGNLLSHQLKKKCTEVVSLRMLAAKTRKVDPEKGGTVFSCDRCGKSFNYVHNLRDHILVHTGEKVYMCGTCKKCFSRSTSLTRHQKVDHQQKVILRNQCMHCAKDFRSLAVVDKHMVECIETIAHINQKHKCITCRETFPSSKNLEEHCESHSEFNPSNNKDISKKKDSAKQARCMVTLTRCDEYKQSGCNKQFSSVKEVDRHRDNSNHTCKRYICPESGNKFLQKNDLTKNDEIHRNIQFEMREEERYSQGSQLGYRCSMCDFTFAGATELAFHMKAHIQQKLYKCSLCEETFQQSADYKQHVMSHSGSECLGHKTGGTTDATAVPHRQGASFQPNHEPHQGYRERYSQDSQLGYRCSMCDLTFPAAPEMAFHMKAHIQQKLYKCSLCDKTFQQSADYKQHVMSHSQSENLKHKLEGAVDETVVPYRQDNKTFQPNHLPHQEYSCSFCGIKFRDARALGRHIKVHKWHTCFQCKETFKKAADYTQHVKSHAKSHARDKEYYHKVKSDKDTAYRCSQRDIKVADSQSLSAHIKLYKCLLCRETFTHLPDYVSHTMSHLKSESVEERDEKPEMSQTSSTYSEFQQNLMSQEAQNWCSLCDIKFADALEFVAHLDLHIRCKLYECFLCRTTFTEAADYKHHMMGHTSVRDNLENDEAEENNLLEASANNQNEEFEFIKSEEN